MRWYPARVIALCFFGLILLGGLGYLVIWELLEWPAGGKKRRLSLQSKVVLSTTGALLLLGTLALRLSEGEWTWLQAFFHSVSARTAGFATADLSAMSQAGLLIMCFLMFVGASPGSTGGGVKTTTLFVVPLALRTTATNSKRQAFKLRILDEAMRKVFTITLMGVLVLLRGYTVAGAAGASSAWGFSYLRQFLHSRRSVERRRDSTAGHGQPYPADYYHICRQAGSANCRNA